MDENTDTKSYSKKSYFTPKNIIIYIIVAIVVYGAVYVLFLKKNGTSYTAPATTNSSSDNSSGSLYGK